jgi:Protein of unknown function (DUF1569)
MSSSPERRELSFKSLDEAVAEVERLARGNTRTTGNHTFGQIVEHLARILDTAVGKTIPPRLPLILRLVMPVAKHIVLRGPVKPGFKLPTEAQSFYWPEGDVDVQQALAHLRESVEDFKTKGPLAINPIFGKLSRERTLKLQCDHCAMHLSFVHPA